MSDVQKINVLDLSLAELTAQVKAWGQPAFRAKQLYRQLWVLLTDEFEAMSDCPPGSVPF